MKIDLAKWWPFGRTPVRAAHEGRFPLIPCGVKWSGVMWCEVTLGSPSEGSTLQNPDKHWRKTA